MNGCVLHIPFSYFPSPHGGTEVFVAALAKELSRHNVQSVVAAPGDKNESYEWEGVRVYRFGVESATDLDVIYGEGDTGAAAEFGSILDRVRPDLVHFHALTPGASVLAMREAKRRGIPLIFTYHTPTVSCVRGTMMKWGRTPCHGLMDDRVCSACSLHSKGLPKTAGMAMSTLPPGALAWIGKKLGKGRMATALQMPALIRKRLGATRTAFSLANQVVAVCDWVRDVLLVNGIPANKITLCRQGLPAGPAKSEPDSAAAALPERFTDCRPLRLAYFGRLDPTKGVHTVINALMRSRTLPVHFDIYGIAQGKAGMNWLERLTQISKADSRIRFLDPVGSTEVTATMQAYDLIAVPSTWLETGPLVVYEAFAASVPILGSDLGGIAELVEDGQTGRLLPVSKVKAWLDTLTELVSHPNIIDEWRTHMPKVRTMADAADEMARLYKETQVEHER